MPSASCPPTTRSTTSSSCPATTCLQPTTVPSGPAPSRRGTTSAASSKPHNPHLPCSPSSSPSSQLPPNNLTVPRTESDQRINVPIRTNTQRFCLVRMVRYQAKGFSSPRNPTRAFSVYWASESAEDFHL